MSLELSQSSLVELTPAMKDFQALDNVFEVQHNCTAHTNKKLLAALEGKNPGLLAKRQFSTMRYLQSNSLGSDPGLSYKGPKLRWPLVEKDVFQLMVHYSKEGHVPLYEGYLCQILAKSIEMFAAMQPVTYISSRSGNHTKLVVVGDLHGQLADLLNIFLEHGFPNPNETQYVFNGDFVDRGDYSVEIITLLLAFKLLYPNTVHLNRGNHETEEVNMSFGFYEEVSHQYPGSLIFRIFITLWNQLPIATVIDEEILVLHGGLFSSSAVTLKHLNSVPKQDVDFDSSSFYDRLRRDCLWSDPCSAPGRNPGKRGPTCIQFGPDVTRSFLQRNQLKLLIRSHQVPSSNGGYEWLHDDLLITVFSASNYCGSQANFGGVVIYTSPGRDPLFAEFYAPPLSIIAQDLLEVLHAMEILSPVQGTQQTTLCNSVSMAGSLGRSFSVRPSLAETDRHARQVVLWHLRDFIKRQCFFLTEFWTGCPEVKPGRISREDWICGLEGVLDVSINWDNYQDDLLPGATATNEGVDWRAFLAQYKVSLTDGPMWWTRLRDDIYARLKARALTLADYFVLMDPKGNTANESRHLQQKMEEWLGVAFTCSQVEDMMEAIRPCGAPTDFASFIQGLHMTYQGKNLSGTLKRFIRVLDEAFADCCGGMLAKLEEFADKQTNFLSSESLLDFVMCMVKFCPDLHGTPGAQLFEEMLKEFGEEGTGSLNLLKFYSHFVPSSKKLIVQAKALVQDITQMLYAHDGSLQTLVSHLDTDGDDCVTAQELQDALLTLVSTLDIPLTPGQVALVVQHLDRESNGDINCRKFLDTFTALRDPMVQLPSMSTETSSANASSYNDLGLPSLPSYPSLGTSLPGEAKSLKM